MKSQPQSLFKPETCPACGSARVVPIVYGLPSDETIEEAKEGRISLGGCVVIDGSPKWACLDCRQLVWPASRPVRR